MPPLNEAGSQQRQVSRLWSIVRGLWRLDDDDEDEREVGEETSSPRDEERGEEGYEEEVDEESEDGDSDLALDVDTRGQQGIRDSTAGSASPRGRERTQLFRVEEGAQATLLRSQRPSSFTSASNGPGAPDSTTLLRTTSSDGSCNSTFQDTPRSSAEMSRSGSFGAARTKPSPRMSPTAHSAGTRSPLLGVVARSARTRGQRQRRRLSALSEDGARLPRSGSGHGCEASDGGTGGRRGPWDIRSETENGLGPEEAGIDKTVDLELTMSVTARLQVARFKHTLQVLGLHAASSSSGARAMSSWLIGLAMLLLVPLYAYVYVQPSDSLPQHELPFQSLVLMIQSALGLNSFIFIIATVKAHGMQGVLFLEAAAHEAPSVQAEYEKCLQQSSGMLWQCLAPLFVLHLVHKCLLYSSIPLQLLPLEHNPPALSPAPGLQSLGLGSSQTGVTTSEADSMLLSTAVMDLMHLLLPWFLLVGPATRGGKGGNFSLWGRGLDEGRGGPSLAVTLAAIPPLRLSLMALVFVVTSASWLFSTSTFIFSCVIFWKVCSLQEFKMLVYREQVRHCADPASCFHTYMRITGALGVISKRFRRFLVHSFAITLLGSLASMFQMIHYHATPLTFTNSGHLVVANFVAIFGTSLCLRSASRLAHHHRRIVRVAATMHAQQTLEGHHATAGAMACSSRRWSSFRYERLIAESKAAAAAASAMDRVLAVARSPSTLENKLQEHQQLWQHTENQQQQQFQQRPQEQQQFSGCIQSSASDLAQGGTQDRLQEGSAQAVQEQQIVQQQQQHEGGSAGLRSVPEDRAAEYLDIVGQVPNGGGSSARLEQRVILFSRRQDAYMQRAALVEFLANTSAGISVYGFVLDRFLIHTSFGALLTTTWFILGRSLGGS